MDPVARAADMPGLDDLIPPVLDEDEVRFWFAFYRSLLDRQRRDRDRRRRQTPATARVPRVYPESFSFYRGGPGLPANHPAHGAWIIRAEGHIDGRLYVSRWTGGRSKAALARRVCQLILSGWVPAPDDSRSAPRPARV